MPTEMRHIVFTPNEVLRSITQYKHRRREPLPSGTISNLKIEERPDVHVVLFITDDAKRNTEEVVFQGAELAAALVMYCIERKIPLPAARAKKTLRVFDKQLGLEVAIGDISS
ncbi:MAG: hypothetical protein JO021_07335 [Alphaproteobacteria bacterium]|nr:hypothetical protein [Alphaproteobacteria bacterium]